jgi:hypothetical protein
MFIHPSIHLEIVRQRRRDLLVRSERRRTVKAALAGRHDDRGWRLLALVAAQEPAPRTTTCRPQEMNT